MDQFFCDYLQSLQELHNDIRNAIRGLPPDALDWNIGNDMNSISVLVVHSIGAERYWIGDIVIGDSSGRDRESEFAVRGYREVELIQRLDDIETYVQRALESLSLQELGAHRISPRSGRQVTVGWVLCHALKHTALHTGHIQITRQLWEEHINKSSG